MASKLYDTPNYEIWQLRAGATIIRKHDNASVYFQPGDDTALLRETIDALDEAPACKRALMLDIFCSQYL